MQMGIAIGMGVGVSGAPPAAALTGHDILTISDNGDGLALVTTAAAHELTGEETVTISGTADYNGVYHPGIADPPTPPEYSVTSPTTLTLQAGFPFTVPNTGGRWD